MPQSIIRSFREERRRLAEIVRGDRDELTVIERARLDELFAQRLDDYLDRGFGGCLLRDPRAAFVLKDTFERFASERYELHAWCVMPNHVHVVMTLYTGWHLDQVFHSWKSYTAHEINKVLRRCGQVWQKEYFDRIVRNDTEMQRVVAYVVNNPTKAGLQDWPWVWASESWWR